MIEVRVRIKNSIGYAPNTESWHSWHIPEIMYSFTERPSRNDWISISSVPQVTQRPSEMEYSREREGRRELMRSAISGALFVAFMLLF